MLEQHALVEFVEIVIMVKKQGNGEEIGTIRRDKFEVMILVG
jgi:hypothetical protein